VLTSLSLCSLSSHFSLSLCALCMSNTAGLPDPKGAGFKGLGIGMTMLGCWMSWVFSGHYPELLGAYFKHSNIQKHSKRVCKIIFQRHQTCRHGMTMLGCWMSWVFSGHYPELLGTLFRIFNLVLCAVERIRMGMVSSSHIRSHSNQ
jgi:hypothetical protein